MAFLRIPEGGVYTITKDGAVEAVKSQKECATISVRKRDMGNCWFLYGPGIKTKETTRENCMKTAAGISAIIQQELSTKTGPAGSINYEVTDGGLIIKAPNGAKLTSTELQTIDAQIVAWVKSLFDGAKDDSKKDSKKDPKDDSKKDDDPKDDSKKDDDPKDDSKKDDDPKDDSKKDDDPKDDSKKDDDPKDDSKKDGNASDDESDDDESDGDEPDDDSSLAPTVFKPQEVRAAYKGGEIDAAGLQALFTPVIPKVSELPKWAGGSDD